MLFVLVWALFASSALAAWGYVDNGSSWTIDTGSNLVVQVSKTNGDMQSIKYKVSFFGITSMQENAMDYKSRYGC